MPRIYIDTEACKSCNICVELCPVNILVLGRDRNSNGYNYVEVRDMDKCTACMNCERFCPEFAIYVEA